GSSVQGTSHFFRVDGFNTSSPSVKVIGDLGDTVGDIAGTDTGIVYAVTFSGTYRVDVATGHLAQLVSADLKGNALAWAQTNVLYAWSFDRASITSFDLNTGEFRTVTSVPGEGADLAWDPTENRLYATTVTSDLYRIDVGAGAYQLVGKLHPANILA